jgi:hypothetical protein
MKIEDIKEKALEVLLRHGIHPPTIFVSGTKADAMILLDELPDDHFESRKYLFLKGAETAKSNTIGALREVYLVSEAWVSIGKPGHKIQGEPKKDPQRTEALVVYKIDVLNKQERVCMFSLKSDAKGIVREISPFQGKEEMQAVSNPFLLTFLAGFTGVALSRKK